MKAVLLKAILDTRGHLMQLIGFGCTGAISLVALAYWYGPTMAIDELPYLLAALIGSFIGVLVVFVWNLACAPLRLEREAHNQTKQNQNNLPSDPEKLLRLVKQKSTFSLKEAACLIAEVPFQSGDLSGVAANYQYEIQKRVFRGEIKLKGDLPISIRIAQSMSGIDSGKSGVKAEVVSPHLEISRKTMQQLAEDFQVVVSGLN